MVIRKQMKISRDEALRYMVDEAPIFKSIISGIFASLVAFVVIYYLISVTRLIAFGSTEFINNMFFILLGVFAALGIATYFTKREEYILYEKTGSDTFIHGVFSYPLYIITFTIIFAIFLLPTWKKGSTGQEYSLSASMVTIFMLAVVFAYLYNGVWKLITFFSIQMLSGRDWLLLAERDFFVSGLTMRFEEARRYGTSLSLLTFTLSISNKKKKMLKTIYKKFTSTLRDIDSISHYESWNKIVVLAPITSSAIEGLFTRMVKVSKETLYAKGWKDKVIVEGGIASINNEVESQFDLLKPHKILKQEITF